MGAEEEEEDVVVEEEEEEEESMPACMPGNSPVGDAISSISFRNTAAFDYMVRSRA